MTADRRDVAPERWGEFFDGFSRRMRGQPVTLSVQDRYARGRILARSLPLMGITAERNTPHDDIRAIEVMVGESPDAHVVHVVENPARVEMFQAADGEDKTMLIESSTGTSVRIEWGNQRDAPDPAGTTTDTRAARPAGSAVQIFASSIQATNAWLNEIQQRIGAPDARQAYQALRAVLHALRDRLTVNEAADFAAQLPLILRGAFYEGWRPERAPLREKHKDEFVARVARELRCHPSIETEKTIRCIFAVIRQHVSDGEITDVQALLPQSLRELWN